MKRLSLVAFAAILSTVGTAQATVIDNGDGVWEVTYCEPFHIGGVSNETDADLPQWGSQEWHSEYTLDAVCISFTAEVTGTFLFVSGEDSGDVATATLNAIVTVDFPSPPQLSDFGSSVAQALAIGESVHVGVAGGTFNQPAILLGDGPEDSSPIGPYIGGGTFLVTIDSTGGWTFLLEGAGSEGQAVVNFSSDIDGEVCVTYKYSPEPASAALLGLGGLGLIARRRTA